MARNTEHNFTLAGEEYHLSFIDKPILLKNGEQQKVLSILKKYVIQASLPIKLKNSKGKDKNTNTIASNILSHFTPATKKTKPKKTKKKDSSKKQATKAESQKDTLKSKLELSKNFKVVMICAKEKKGNSNIIHENFNHPITFVAQPNGVNTFLPDGDIPNLNMTWRDYVTNNQNNNVIPFKSYQLYIHGVYQNLFNFFRYRLFILSAGWGLVKAEFRLPNYNITFSSSAKPEYKRVFNNLDPSFNDFNDLTYNHNVGLNSENEDIVFIGGRTYIKQFIARTDGIGKNKIIYHFGNEPLVVLPDNFFYVQYVPNNPNNYRTWHYELAQKYADGEIP